MSTNIIPETLAPVVFGSDSLNFENVFAFVYRKAICSQPSTELFAFFLSTRTARSTLIEEDHASNFNIEHLLKKICSGQRNLYGF